MRLLADLLDDADAQLFVGRLKRTDFFFSGNRVKQLTAFLPLVESAAARKGYENTSNMTDSQR
jgi:hypothetical protein